MNTKESKLISEEKFESPHDVTNIVAQEVQVLALDSSGDKVEDANAENVTLSLCESGEITEEVTDSNRPSPQQDPNDDDCYKCKGDGQLLCCDGCPRAWHLECLDPPLEQVPEGVWNCPMCEKKNENGVPNEDKGKKRKEENKRKSSPRKSLKKKRQQTSKRIPKANKNSQEFDPEGPSKKRKISSTERLSGPWYSCYVILQTLKEHGNAWPFIKPVDTQMWGNPDYFDRISHPMDLTTVEENLINENYATLDDFANDIRLIWNNARTYNGPNSRLTYWADDLSRHFEKMFASLKKCWNEYLSPKSDSKEPPTKKARLTSPSQEAMNPNTLTTSPVNYIRVFYEGRTIKADASSLVALHSRIITCFPQLFGKSYFLKYCDEDGIQIDLLDEQCFNIFLNSTVPKDLRVEF